MKAGEVTCAVCQSPMFLIGDRWNCSKCAAALKYPIYPCEVIEVACRALAALGNMYFTDETSEADRKTFWSQRQDVAFSALRIIRDGLASHEKAIKGES